MQTTAHQSWNSNSLLASIANRRQLKLSVLALLLFLLLFILFCSNLITDSLANNSEFLLKLSSPIILNGSNEEGQQQKQKQQQQQSSRKLLRIAQIATMEESVPPKKYGGTERIISYLTEELVRRGHQVTLFAANDSVTSARLVAKWPHYHTNPVADRAGPIRWLVDQARVRADQNQFDILHFHTDVWSIEMVDKIFMENHTALLMTMHGLLSWYPQLNGPYRHIPHVSISLDQRTQLIPGPKWVGNVYHGIPQDLYKFVKEPATDRPYLAFLGRISVTKLPDWAIKIAVKAGFPLKIAARADADDYWLHQIKPLIDQHRDLVEFVGELNDTQKGPFLGNAFAFLFPISWHEPFGMVMVEAMACGTPVIGRRMGSVPEVIDEGVTGLLFDTIDEAAALVEKVKNIDRAGVRRRFDERFTVEVMVDNYEKIYHQFLEANNVT